MLFRVHDLVRRFAVHIDRGGFSSDFFADTDQIAPDRQIVNRLRIIANVEDRHGSARETGQIGGSANLRHAFICFEKRFQRDRRRQRVLLNAPRGGFINALMQRIIKMMRLDDG